MARTWTRICATKLNSKFKIKNGKWKQEQGGAVHVSAFFIFHFSFLIVLAADPDVSKLPPPASRRIDFAADIKPIFEVSCFRCHGTEKPKSKFSLATREGALKGGDDGIDIIPGDSAKSPLIHYVAGLVPGMEMPRKGEPLTSGQVSLLRAWIEQGALWEHVDLSAQYAPQFSFTPAVRYVTVSGNARKFQEHQWVRRGFSEGVSDFRLAQKFTTGVSVVVEGRALTDDYKVTLDVRKEDVSFARSGFEQSRKYYDDHGPYFPFRARGFATATPNIFSLDRDLHLDRGKAFVEFGLTLPDWPRAVLGYEFQFRNGSEATEQWGPVTQTTGGKAFTRHIYPARKNIDEDVHVLRLDVSHDIAGAHIEDNMRAEFFDLKTKRANDIDFPAGQAYPAAFTTTRETHNQVQFANTLHGGKSIRDWLFVSAGYLFTQLEADATLNQKTSDGAGRPAAGFAGAATDIVLKESAHVFNANTLLGPWDGFTAALGVQNEWSEQRGFGHQNLADIDPNDPTSVDNAQPRLVASAIDRLIVEENLVLRYTAIPATVLFAEARLRQERSAKFEELFGDHDFLRDTDANINRQEYKTGFEASPWRWASLNASYKHKRHDSHFHDERDEQPISTNGPSLNGPGYPAFIRSRATDSDLAEMRLTLRPVTWLKTTLSYQVGLTDYDTVTDPVHVVGINTPGGHIFAGEYDSATYSANVTVTPARRWYLSTTLSYQESRTRTAANGSLAVAPYRGDTYSVLASSTFVLSERTDLVGSYSFSRARFGQHNFASGLPLGIDYDLHGVQLGVTHRINTNMTTGVQYGFFKYNEPTAHGFNDYTAHMIFGTFTMRLP